MITLVPRDKPNETKGKPAAGVQPIKLPPEKARAIVSEMILSLSLFQDLPRSELDRLASLVDLCEVGEDSTLFLEGEEGGFIGLVVEGIADLSKQKTERVSVRVASEGTGRILGEMALVDGERRSATAKFPKGGKVLILSKANFEKILSQYPSLGVQLLIRICRLLSQRLRKTTGLLAEKL